MQAVVVRSLSTLHYVFDRTVSRFTVQAFATGLLSVFGHDPRISIRDYHGDLEFVPGTFDKAHVRVTVTASTFEVLDEMKREDREKLDRSMFDDILEIQKFPQVIYESNLITIQKTGDGTMRATVNGELTLHGVTQNHSFDVRALDMGTMLRLSGEFSLRQSAFGIKPFSFGGGVMRLKDELKFTFDMVARLEE